MIRVITFGTPSFLPTDGFLDVINYVSVRDGISFLDPIGHLLALIGKAEHIVYLGTHWGIPFIDHYLTSDTYRTQLEVLGDAFITSYKDLDNDLGFIAVP